MLKRYTALTVAALFTFATVPALATSSQPKVATHKHSATKQKAPAAKPKPPAQKKVVSAVCPVMGTKIPDVTKAAGKSVYKGKTYYFCCPNCKPLFDKNPEKYIKKAPAKKKSGK